MKQFLVGLRQQFREQARQDADERRQLEDGLQAAQRQFQELQDRQSVLLSRLQAQTHRVGELEQALASAEQALASAEQARVSSEQARVSAEQAREVAEVASRPQRPAAPERPRELVTPPRRRHRTGWPVDAAWAKVFMGAVLIGFIAGLGGPWIQRRLQQQQALSGSAPITSQEQLYLQAMEPSWLEVRRLDGTMLFAGELEGEKQFPLGEGVEVSAGRPDLVTVRVDNQPPRVLGRIEEVDWHRFQPGSLGAEQP
ncbi:RodZ domain-containing protein [Synechococcus sp. CBW1006]|uniref:RodZ domain-containing protein n=1 Tax=Synechococcus sp. CBW1006 TaxID=1353138 RepID=UPI0018CE2D66|nr:RodZ domain-containing protein [Synechococcus sp. CBW1006]QPN66961.1 DUF4115 domain-containing protein [Synechococcus sp. CBW1006]